MKQDILSLDTNKSVGQIELNESIFGLEVRADILHRVVVWQLARLQCGNHKTKGRSEVALTGSKPFKQKGGGRARQGSYKGTQFRKGGVVFGPVVRDHSHELTKKFRKLGLKTALSAKAKEGNLIVVEEGAKAELVEYFAYEGNPKARYFNNIVNEIYLGAKAEFNHYKFQNESYKAVHIALNLVRQKKGSVYGGFCLQKGADLGRNETRVQLTI